MGEHSNTNDKRVSMIGIDKIILHRKLCVVFALDLDGLMQLLIPGSGISTVAETQQTRDVEPVLF